jgi:restriction system protein
MATAWVVRSGKHGEREAWALTNGYAGTGWWEFDDLTPLTTRAAIAQAAAERLRDLKDWALANYTGQLWALRSRIQPGDLMVLPLKTTRQLALAESPAGTSTAPRNPTLTCATSSQWSGSAPTCPAAPSSRTCCSRWAAR